MRLFDEDGNYVGEFLMDSIENVKDKATDALDDGSWILGLITLIIIFPGWALLCGVIYIIIRLIWWMFKLAISACKFIIRILWWMVRLPFSWIFQGDFPEF